MVQRVGCSDGDAGEFLLREHLAPIGVNTRDRILGSDLLSVGTVASAEGSDLGIRACRRAGEVKALTPEPRAHHGEGEALRHPCLRLEARPFSVRSAKISAIACGVRRPPGEY